MGTKIARIAEIAKERPNEVFTSIYHLINEELLRECHKELDGSKATGIDDVTKAEYEENLDKNIANLHERLARMGYRPTPAKRIYIPKANGKVRGIAIATYEDKIVQLALKKLIEAIYEPKFPNNMYGFRPKKSCHDAVNDLRKIIQFENINYVVEADIKSYFDNINHEWLMKGLELHIKDPRVLRLVKRFLIAGIMEDGKVENATQGTPQGSVLSPLLANIYMYYMLVLWFEKKVQKDFKGKCYLINFADDFVCCFELEEEAKRFYQEMMPARLQKFNLELAEDKTRMIEFGKYAIAHSNRLRQRTKTFDFLGFTFYCGISRRRKFSVKLKTAKKKYRKALKETKQWIKNNRNVELKIFMQKITEKLRGHFQYFGVSGNYRDISKFKFQVIKSVYKWLNRRSQKKSYTWEEFNYILKLYKIPNAKICVDLYA